PSLPRPGASGEAGAHEESPARADEQLLAERFLSTVAHEMKNQLHALQMTTALVRRSPRIPEQEQAQLAMVESGIRGVSRYVTDLLDFLRNRAGLLALTPTECDIVPVVRSAVEMLKLQYNARRTEFDSPGTLVGHFDADRLVQVVNNLVINAVKYGSPDAPVTVALRDDDSAMVLEVSNYGEPIPAAAIPALFDPYVRVASNGLRHRDGLGLGLAVVRQIVLKHGGAIDVTSGERTTFTVVLPKYP
ncbi:MAG: sensor histidine kinase, partial [Myxococcales bacterium]